MEFSQSIEIAAPAERVWRTMLDVERWPEWTPTVTRSERLDAGELGVGSRVRVRQPGVPAVVWQVTQLALGRSFTWHSGAAGVLRSSASHFVETLPAGGCRVTLSVSQTGVLAWLTSPWLSRTTRRYLEMEAQGLKRRCETVSDTRA